MTRYEKAAAVRDIIADQILDGRTVISVGIRGSGNNCSIAVTATKEVALPELPDEFSDVAVHVNVIGPTVARNQ